MRTTIAIVLALTSGTLAATRDVDWPFYGGNGGGAKYSPLDQIDRTNVGRLTVAWTFRTGEPTTPLRPGLRGPAFEATPIVVDGLLYFGSPYGGVFALDPASGALRWKYDTGIDRSGNYGDFVNRGVSTWLDRTKKSGEPCRRVIFMASIDARLTALDGARGTPCPGFGAGGTIDLTAGLRNPPRFKGEYEQTSPPAVLRNLVIVGSAVADNVRARTASGEVRAFDARTGALQWTWHPLEGDTTGGANAWSILSVDEARNLVFVPTGSPSPDYWGGLRPGDNRFANSAVALDGNSGRPVWHFQTVHHDLWDYDVASQPLLLTVKRAGRSIPAVAVGSKTGHLFLLDRGSGAPIFGVEERPVPSSDVDGESASPTQPVPVLPKPWIPQTLRPEEVWGMDDAERQACRDAIASLRNEGIFTPPSVRGSLVVPGNIGGMHWGGMAWDERNGLLLVPSNNMPSVVRLIPQDRFSTERPTGPGWEIARQTGTPYTMARRFLLSPKGLPCSPPPWGTVAAIDTATGAVRWRSPLGELPWAPAGTAPDLGSINVGGPIVTAGGLVFIGASFDAYLKAFDVLSGRLVWRGPLPASARSTPMTYATGGRQFVAVAAGGHDADLGRLDNAIVAFALP